jgi:Co/Zn/Cd efflux system component
MSACCGDQACAAAGAAVSPRFRKALWVALVINAIMFAVEIVAGMRAGSMSLFADALDFASDAANYGITLAALSLGVAWRAPAAWVKGASMFAFGLFVIVRTAWAAYQGQPPEPFTMGAVAFLALLANGGVALMLYAFRDGDANMRSVWLCSRNDAIGNVAVMLAAAGVFGTGQGWPDLAVAAVLAGLALSAGWSVMRQAARELANVHGFSPPKLVTIAIDSESRRRPG